MDIELLIQQAYSSSPPDPATPSPELEKFIDGQSGTTNLEMVIGIIPVYQLDSDDYEWDADLHLAWIEGDISEQRYDELSYGASLTAEETVLFKEQLEERFEFDETYNITYINRIDAVYGAVHRGHIYFGWHGIESGSQHSAMVSCSGPFRTIEDALSFAFSSVIHSHEVVLREGKQEVVLKWLDEHNIQYS